MSTTETPTTAQPNEREADTQQRAVLVEYQKYTDAEAKVLGMLSSRGFKLASYGTADGIDPDRAYLTILLAECDEKKFGNALMQIEKVVTVISAKRRELSHVTQNLHARVIGLTDEERAALKKQYKAIIHRAAEFTDVNDKHARKVTRTLHEQGAKVARVRKERPEEVTAEEEAAQRLSIRIKAPSAKVEKSVEELGGSFRDMEYVRLNAQADQVSRLADHMRGQLLDKVEYMTVSSPRASLKTDDDLES